jgi:hypothetical protein
MGNFYSIKENYYFCEQSENVNLNLQNFDVPFRGLVVAPYGCG